LLERADVDLVPMRNLVEPATKLAISLNHPAYDCLYLALAETIEASFVTADELLVRRAKATELRARVLLLGSAMETIRADGDKP
jgi:predicted nucleic acid-binding protein